MTSDQKYIIDWFKNHVWARPASSKICDGVGMFAIRYIPKGTSIYDLPDKTCCAFIPWKTVQTLPKGIIEMIIDLQPQVGSNLCKKEFWWKSEYGPIWMYTTKGLNWQTNWYFQNHSKNPNVDAYVGSHPRHWIHIANRDIDKGEELFENYDSSVTDWTEVSKVYHEY